MNASLVIILIIATFHIVTSALFANNYYTELGKGNTLQGTAVDTGTAISYTECGSRYAPHTKHSFW